jgi:outer membrane protein OmpA-like peptidoglycan-associated protein/uncharacterized protein YidB (DUF937 family)
MPTFDTLVHEMESRYSLGSTASPAIQETLRLITERPGGIGRFVRRFKAAGFSVEVASWLQGSDPVPLSGQEVEQTLGSEVVAGIANRLGLSQRFARTILGYSIPSTVALLTQGDAIPTAIIRASTQLRPSRTEGGGVAPVLGGLIIPCTSLLIMSGLLLGYFIGVSDREVIPSTPIVAQKAPVAPLDAPLARWSTTASASISGVSGKNQFNAPSQSAHNFPIIHFIANTAEVMSGSNPLLLQAAHLIKQLPVGTLVEVAGYTHNFGNPATNMQLSQRRADAVRRALVRAGVDPKTLTAKGYGGSSALTQASQNGTVEGRSNGLTQDHRRDDRRVEFGIAHQ